MFSMLFDGTKTIYVNGKATHSSIGTKLFGLIWGECLEVCLGQFWYYQHYYKNHFYLIGYIIGLFCILGMAICLKYIPKRTPYGNEILGI